MSSDAGDPAAVTTRRATAADAPAVARILVSALGDKYRPALGRWAVQAVAAEVRHGVLAGHGGYFVAELGGTVAGAAHLALGEPREAGYLRRLADEVGWLVAARAFIVLSLLGEGRRAADEGYVEELGVAESARRRGVARALLAVLEEEARATGRRRLTLWVTTDNAAALALYRGFGFLAVRHHRWIAGRLVFGAPGAVFMEKVLTP
jgi:ribosomal protein S18 acetylase RimI-like enzyme